jgi:hypothetical protein
LADLDTRVLVRTTRVDADTLALAQQLQQASGAPVALVADARSGAVDGVDPDVIALSSAACGELRLFCPPDFAWRCGDYGYYLARRRYPTTRRFWLIETDVAICGGDAAELFAFFAARASEVDLLAAQLRAADHSWYWTPFARGRDVQAFRCLFPITRLSARAIDAARSRRVAQGRRLQRRWLWPNDEALIATTLMNGDFVCRDFNDFGTTFYSDDSFFFGAPLQGERLRIEARGPRLVHPVLFGADYAEKLAKLKQPEPALSGIERRRRWLAAKLNARSRW